METSIGAILVAGVLLSAVVLTTRFATFSSTVTGSAIKETADLTGERLRTEFNIQFTTSSGTNLKVQLDNTGTVAISKFEDMDFIVDYISSPGSAQMVERLTYQTGTSPGSGEWVVSSILANNYEPGIWNPGEGIILDSNVTATPETSTTATLAVGAHNAVVATTGYSN